MGLNDCLSGTHRFLLLLSVSSRGTLKKTYEETKEEEGNKDLPLMGRLLLALFVFFFFPSPVGAFGRCLMLSYLTLLTFGWYKRGEDKIDRALLHKTSTNSVRRRIREPGDMGSLSGRGSVFPRLLSTSPLLFFNVHIVR